VKVPGGKFSIYDFRIFGKGKGKVPDEVSDFTVDRNPAEPRKTLVTWPKDDHVTGYIVNYGTGISKLYTSVMVYDGDSVKLTGLNRGVTYYFNIDAFNESGVTVGKKKITSK
jgi:xylan 1,4-beta-xylosidase